VVVILMENEESSSIVGNNDQCALHYQDPDPVRDAVHELLLPVSHPSLPNYLALTVGNTCGKDGPTR